MDNWVVGDRGEFKIRERPKKEAWMNGVLTTF
jgi:hypothetical protein